MALLAYENNSRSGIAHYIADLLGAARGVYRHRHRAVGIGAEISDQYFRTVGSEYGKHFLRLDTERFEGACRCFALSAELIPRCGHPFVAAGILATECLALAVACGVGGHKFCEYVKHKMYSWGRDCYKNSGKGTPFASNLNNLKLSILRFVNIRLQIKDYI